MNFFYLSCLVSRVGFQVALVPATPDVPLRKFSKKLGGFWWRGSLKREVVETQIHGHRHADIQTDRHRHTDRQTDRQTDTDTDTDTNTDTDTDTDTDTPLSITGS